MRGALQPGPADDAKSQRAALVVKVIVISAAVTALLWLLRVDEVSVLGLACLFTLIAFPTATYLRWRAGKDSGSVPVFAFVSGVYALSFSLPLVWGEHQIQFFGRSHPIPHEAIDTAMTAAVVGVAMMCTGYYSRFARGGKIRELVEFQSTPRSHYYLYAVLIVGLMAERSVARLTAFAGEALRQPLAIAVGVLPLAVYALLVLEYQRGRVTWLWHIIIPAYFLAAVTVGVASGWLGSAVAIVLITVVAYAMKRRRMPRLALGVIFVIVLFLEPGKQTFRERYWSNAEQAGATTRALDWFSESARMWNTAFSGGSSQAWTDLAMRTVSRLDLLTQTANVLDRTPSMVPYQYGKLYQYFLVTYIPRVLWPEKPSMNEANRWYQVSYGLTSEERLDSVSIACGFLAEGYINFGWPGLLGIMFSVGIFLAWFERAFLSPGAGIYMNALGLALLHSVLAIESQMAQYLSGMVQTVLLTTVLLAPVLVISKKKMRGRLTAIRVRAVSPAHAPNVGEFAEADQAGVAGN